MRSLLITFKITEQKTLFGIKSPLSITAELNKWEYPTEEDFIEANKYLLYSLYNNIKKEADKQ